MTYPISRVEYGVKDGVPGFFFHRDPPEERRHVMRKIVPLVIKLNHLTIERDAWDGDIVIESYGDNYVTITRDEFESVITALRQAFDAPLTYEGEID